MRIYESIPTLASPRFLLRAVREGDLNDLLRVYGDRNALPFFNSDNCHGDNFYYNTPERMKQAMDFWTYSYDNRFFARMAIEDRAAGCVAGTVEICLRASQDAFDGVCVLRVDVRSDYETADALCEVFSLIAPQIPGMLDCRGIITKAPIYAVERIAALERAGFEKSAEKLIGHDGTAYDGYWTKG